MGVKRSTPRVERRDPIIAVDVTHHWGVKDEIATRYAVQRVGRNVRVARGGKELLDVPAEVAQQIAEAINDVNRRATAEQETPTETGGT